MPRTAGAQIAVVVHPSNGIEELSLDKLRRLFLGQARTFPAGDHARLAVHSGSSATFDRAALGLQPEIVRSRWMAMIFRGESTSIPTELATPDDVKRFVHDHPDAIAFLPLSQVDASVKTISIDGHRPNDAGYVIH
ncbi:MAG TPA: hypothetical protein VGP25_00370 [Gemmatimonadaceae bacterium]|nr:hypothetical protein [Gemmatimonadaceae bacterium]